jgi:hypothetical protein
VCYVIADLSLSVPALVAGAFVSLAGLVPTIVGYGILVSLSAIIALLAQFFRARHAQDARSIAAQSGRASDAVAPAARR